MAIDTSCFCTEKVHSPYFRITQCFLVSSDESIEPARQAPDPPFKCRDGVLYAFQIDRFITKGILEIGRIARDFSNVLYNDVQRIVHLYTVYQWKVYLFFQRRCPAIPEERRKIAHII